jgi:NAD(P)-dependent dehydrogenase (short-subunit alcohol dehydrogenase family)
VAVCQQKHTKLTRTGCCCCCCCRLSADGFENTWAVNVLAPFLLTSLLLLLLLLLLQAVC